MPRIVHIAIKVDDLEKATKFYEEVFGFRQTSTGYARGHVSRHLTDGNIDLALMVYDSEDVEEAQLSGPGPCIHHWGIEVEDRRSSKQAAMAEVLSIISTSPTKLQPVLDVVVKSAARFCGADDATIFELHGQDLCATAHWGPIPQTIGLRMPCTRGSVRGRAVLEQKTVHVLDLQAEAEEFPEGSAFAKRLGSRTTLGVPLLREGVAVGTIQLRRAEV